MFPNMKLIMKSALAVLAISAVPAFSTNLQTFNNQNLFNAELSNYYTVGFENLITTQGSALSYQDLNGYLDSTTGVRFVGVNSTDSPFLNIYLPAFGQNTVIQGSGAILLGPYWLNQPSRYTLVTPPSPVYAFGLSMATMTPSGGAFSIYLSTGDTFSPIATVNPPASQWFGVISDTAITSIQIRSLTGQPMMDNFEFGTPLAAQQDTPEVASLLMIGSGLAGLSLLKKLRRQRPLAV